MPLAPRQPGTFGRSVSSLGAPGSPARPAVCSRLGSGKEETQGGPARAAGSRGDMGSSEEDYNFVFKGESCAPCHPPLPQKGWSRKAGAAGREAGCTFPRTPSWDDAECPCSWDGHRELRRGRALGSTQSEWGGTGH